MKEWKYNIENGGCLTFDGVQCDGKGIAEIVVDKSSDERWAKVKYSDGYVAKVTATHSVDGDVEKLTDISFEWGKNL